MDDLMTDLREDRIYACPLCGSMWEYRIKEQCEDCDWEQIFEPELYNERLSEKLKEREGK